MPVCDVAPDTRFLSIQTDPGQPKTAVDIPFANPATQVLHNPQLIIIICFAQQTSQSVPRVNDVTFRSVYDERH